MKLLLTSGGITNDAIGSALGKLVGKPAGDTSVAVIPTAANAEAGDKDWFLSQNFEYFYGHNFSLVDIVDPSADGVDWRERLKDVDVIFVSGGNTFHLLNQMRKSGFDDWLKANLENKVYVGVSAGSIVVGPSIQVAGLEPADQNLPELTDLTGLELVNFEIEPHCEGDRFITIKKYAESRSCPVYAIGDQNAIVAEGDKVEVIGEGEWDVYGKK